MKVPFSSGKKLDEYEKMEEEKPTLEVPEEQTKGLFSTLVQKKVDTCCFNPKNCCLVQNAISQRVIETVKDRFSK